ncbi:MAG: hypothetical protein KC468_29460, partial [Myxococcales bacterium]|nr:hypothetical protein [Myxococcales bacterium]
MTRHTLVALSVILLGSARCGSGLRSEPAPSAAPEPAPATTNAAPLPARVDDVELRALLLHADLVVVGELELHACLDGCLGVVRVLERVRGETVERELSVVTEPPAGGMTAAPERALMFLRRALEGGDRWQLVLTERRAPGLDPALATQVRATSVPRASSPEEREPFATELATLRGHDQSAWNGAKIVDPARRVFENLDLRGLTQGELVTLIGEPARREHQGSWDVWTYTFHDGEQGVIPRVYWRSD